MYSVDCVEITKIEVGLEFMTYINYISIMSERGKQNINISLNHL